MSQTFVNGAKYAFSTVLGASVPLSNITNANPAVASVTGPAVIFALNDIVLLQSNWTDLNDLATYGGAAGVLSLIDTLDLGVYFLNEDTPASFRVASSFVNISQIRDLQQTGGDTNTFVWGYIDDRSPRQRSKPTDQNPLVLTFILDYDPSQAWANALESVSKKRQLCVMRETLPTGDVLLYTGNISYQKSPSRVRNENMTVTAVMSVNSDILRFPSAFFV